MIWNSSLFMAIKAVIFDFAGVLTTSGCWPAVAKKLSAKLGIEKELILKHLYAKEDAIVRGEQSTRDFWEQNLKEIGIPFDAFEEEFAHWYELNAETLKLARELKNNYRIVVFSDNFDAATPFIRKEPVLANLFEEMFFSNEMHLIKAEEASFKHVLKEIALKAEECVFIDDKETNFTNPKKIGLHTILFKDVKQVRKELEGLGIGF